MSEVHKKDTVDVVEEEDTEVATEAAASALTALSIQSNMEMTDCEDSAFEIPERFTKSGRKKAVPFPVKVSKGYVDLYSTERLDCSLSDLTDEILVCFVACLAS